MEQVFLNDKLVPASEASVGIDDSSFLYGIGLFETTACGRRQGAPADTALINAKIYTVNADAPRAEAIAVRDGKIIAVGSNKEIAGYQDSSGPEKGGAHGL